MTQDNGARALAERLCASRAPAVTPTGDMFVDDECRALAAAILANGAVFLPDAAELNRLRRIEAAARAFFDGDPADWPPDEEWDPAILALRAALVPEGSAGSSPFELWERANGDGVEYLRLMREHGHIVPGKRPPGEDVFGHKAAEGSARDG